MTHRMALVATVAWLAMLGVGAPVHAQVRAASQGVYDSRSVAYDNGYRRGFDQGQDDMRSGRPADYRRDRDYRDAEWGYDRRYGSRDEYRTEFRRGYQVGYADAYEGRGYENDGRPVPRDPYGYPPNRYPGDYGSYRYPSGPYGYGRNVATDNGYNDGYEKGMDDARRNRRPDVDRHDWFRDGDRHYNSRYGTREQYKISYREGFRRGYDAGYRDAQRGRYGFSFGIRIPF